MKTSKLCSAFFLSLALASSFTSCATLVNGTRQNISISSQPSDANIWLDSMYVGRTPMIVQVPRSDSHLVTISLEGYEPYQIVFSKRLSGWVFGNIIFGGFIGLAIDAITGSIYTLTPDQVQATLTSGCMQCSKTSRDSCVTVVLAADPSWKKIGNLTPLQHQKI